MNKLLLVTTAILLMAVNFPALSETEAEQTARTVCAGCHGPNGISTNPLWPNLAGQKAEYTAKQLQAYRDGLRQDPNMTGMAQTLSDAQIEALAAYYAKLPAGG